MQSDQSFDAFLLVSFGGPERTEDVVPFLENVTAGRGIPRERLVEVGRHYYLFDGVSPINRQCRELLAALRAEFDTAGLDLPLYWGNRNWDPYLTDTVRQMAADGVRRAVAFLTSAYSSYSSCRQYHDDVARARAEAGPGAPEIEVIPPYATHPGFVEAAAATTRAALERLGPDAAGARLVFTAHSIPLTMAGVSGPSEHRRGPGGGYAAQLEEVGRLVAERLGHREFDLVYQSRSGPPSQPWLEPDICDHLESLREQGVRAVVVSPIGFVSDHMEIKYDLDVEAAQAAEKLGLRYARAAAPGHHPGFAAMVRELVTDRARGAVPAHLGTLPALPAPCRDGCCPLRAPAPAG
ncbi:ferrochelatase [Allonocardiopsis opalescens]|uniref:Coproporphyrin III ferrochelatase n=1 Tax=Allonocardiopsis opalescens TaxID=1144618 RepID=A0A2T0PU63_9ACTN|nr:ferrochelatase [Allonocardiopsis opalescens]PRX92439.1 ferrochelatase [Allonocardiopsis opalescens]